MRERKNAAAGSALLGTLVTIVIVGGAIGGGIYLIHQHRHAKTTTNTAAVGSGTVNTGTTASITQLTEADAQAEAGVDQSADTNLTQDATSANTAQSNVGGAYNETNF